MTDRLQKGKPWLNGKVCTIAIYLLLGACSSVPPEQTAATDSVNQVRSKNHTDAPGLAATTASDPVIPSTAPEPGKRSQIPARNEQPAPRNFIVFAQNERMLSEESRAKLYGFAMEIKRNPKHIVTLKAFSDNWGSRDYNLAMLEQRLRTVSETLHEFGIQKSRIRAVLMGQRAQTRACAKQPCPNGGQLIEVQWKP
jgi:peptidoglycan-associated lipoprotein